MATLTGATIAATYAGLLSVTGAISTGAVEVVQDGAGTNTALWLAINRAEIKLGTSAADDFIVKSGSTNVLLVEGDASDTGGGAINKVGIGTSTPQAVLSVTGASDVSPDYGLFQITTGSGALATSKLTFGVYDENYSYIQSIKTGIQAYDLALQPVGGYVGIGTGTPTSQLTVDAAGGGIIELRRNDADNTIGNGDIMGIIDFTGDAPVADTFEPAGRIAVAANAGWSSNNHPSRMDFFVNGGSSSTAITDHLKMRIDNLGNLLIGKTAVAASGHTAICLLNGNDPASATTNTACLYTSGGSMYLTNAAGASGSIDSTSDDRMKDNITVIPDSLSRLASLKGITFNYVSYKNGTLPFKGDIADDVEFAPYKIWGDDTRVGVIAQDVETAYDGLNITNAVMEIPVEASPEADTPEIYGEVKTVRVETLIPLLIEAVKELSTKVTALENA